MIINVAFRALVRRVIEGRDDNIYEIIRASIDLEDDATDKAKKTAITKAMNQLRTELDAVIFKSI